MLSTYAQPHNEWLLYISFLQPNNLLEMPRANRHTARREEVRRKTASVRSRQDPALEFNCP